MSLQQYVGLSIGVLFNLVSLWLIVGGLLTLWDEIQERRGAYDDKGER